MITNLQIIEAIIYAQFNNRPGRRKVFAGEFELFENFHTKMLPINSANCPHPRPGMCITMAIIIGQYYGSRRCPRLGCPSTEVSLSDADRKGLTGTIWYSPCPSHCLNIELTATLSRKFLLWNLGTKIVENTSNAVQATDNGECSHSTTVIGWIQRLCT